MIINQHSLTGLYTGFALAFNEGLGVAPVIDTSPLVLNVPSSSAENAYPFLGQVPGLRKWVGDRQVKNLLQDDYRGEIEVPRTAIENDQYNVYAPLFKDLGAAVAEHKTELIFQTLAAGFASLCYDGQYFFDSDHPVMDKDGVVQTVSNMAAGSETAWYLIDAKKAMKPIIFQDRVKPSMTRQDKENDPNVFDRDVYVYRARWRCGVGYGFWQTGFAGRTALTAANFAAACAAMSQFKGDGGRVLGIRPTHLLVPPTLEGAAREILISERNAQGATNLWRNSAELLVSPHLS